MASPEVFVALCTAAAAAAYIYSRLVPTPDGATRDRFRSYPRYTIGAFPNDREGRLVGNASRADDALRAPMTGRECLAYVFRAYEYRRRGEGWELILEVSEAVTFAAADDTGTAMVRARGAKLALAVDRQDQSDSLCPAKPALEAFLQSRGLTSAGKMLKYDEAILVAGQPVAVCGRGQREADVSEGAQHAIGYRDLGTRLVMDAVQDGQLLIGNLSSVLD